MVVPKIFIYFNEIFRFMLYITQIILNKINFIFLSILKNLLK